MSPSKVLTLMAALMAIVCVVAAGVYFYKQKRDVAVDGGKTPPIAATPPPSEQAARPEAPPLPQAKPDAGGGEAEPQAAKLPSFDVILVEPGGEGVIAGRAEPGWQVNIESGGRTVARVTADAQGEWSIALKEPLPPGDHALSLSAQSPDGKQALESAKSESIAVAPAKDKKIATAPAGEMQEPAPAAPAEGATPGDKSLIAPKASETAAVEAPQTEEEIPGDKSLIAPKAAETTLAAPLLPPQTAEEVPGDKSLIAPLGEERHAAAEPATVPESAAPGEVPGDRSLVEPGAPKPSPGPQAPPVRIRTVDYADLAPGKGRMTLDGTSPPGSTVYLYFDDERLAEVSADADGKWQFEMEKVLPSGHHQFRAEWYDEASGVLAGRTIVAVERVKPAPEFAAKENAPLAATPVPPESGPASGEIPGDKSLIAPKAAEVAKAEQPAQEGSPPGAANEEEIAGDKSLIAPNASETAVAEASEPGSQGAEDIPGDKGLIAPETSEKAAQAPATADESLGGIPGDKSLVEPKPSEQTAVAEVSEAEDREAEPTAQDESPAQDEAIPGDRSLIEASPQIRAGPAGEGSIPAVKSVIEPAGKDASDSLNVASKSEAEGDVPGDKSLIQSPEEKPGEKIAAAPTSPMVVRERRTEIYWIKRGDTLWDLAEQYLDAGWRYKRIYRTNSDIIRNPHWIYPDQVLVIPEP